MRIYFKKFIPIFAAVMALLASGAQSETYRSSHVSFVNKINDSLVIVKYPHGHMPNITSEFVFVPANDISPPILLEANDMIGLFRFIDIGIPKPSPMNDYNKASFLRIFANPSWSYNTHTDTPEAYSFYRLDQFNTDKRTMIAVGANMNIRRGKPELFIGQGYSIIPIGKPADILKNAH